MRDWSLHLRKITDFCFYLVFNLAAIVYSLLRKIEVALSLSRHCESALSELFICRDSQQPTNNTKLSKPSGPSRRSPVIPSC